jgi:hypothetical protein
MNKWPELKTVLIAHGAISLFAFIACLLWLRSLPVKSDLVMANDFSFQVVVAMFYVGIPSIILLFLILFVGSIIKSYRTKNNSDSY